jgi:hypothetical protein
MKNRKREICTSGSVRDEDGQPPHLLGHRRQFLHLAAGARCRRRFSRTAAVAKGATPVARFPPLASFAGVAWRSAMRLYVASKRRSWPWWAAMRACGVPIISSWIDWSFNHDETTEPSSDAWREHSFKCLEEAASCDVLLLYVENGTQHFGALLEAGAALGAGRQVFLVSPHPWPFLRCHPRCRSFDTLEQAIAAIMAGQRGEKARRANGRGARVPDNSLVLQDST